MHPFYGPSTQQLGQRTCSWVGLASMMAYLLFWAAALSGRDQDAAPTVCSQWLAGHRARWGPTGLTTADGYRLRDAQHLGQQVRGGFGQVLVQEPGESARPSPPAGAAGAPP